MDQLDPAAYGTISARKGSESSNHLFPLLVKSVGNLKQRSVFRALREANIGCAIHYAPIPLNPFFVERGFSAGMFPNAESFFKQEISIPIYVDLKRTEQQLVINVLNELV